jgi:hypothetical protein
MATRAFNRNQWLQRGSSAARRSIKQSEAADDYKEFLERQKALREAEQAVQPVQAANTRDEQEPPTAH